MNINDLEKALQKSWCQETAYEQDKWNAKNPALGQCAVSALIVNDYFGGEIIWAEVTLPDGEKVSHYFNLINGEEVDLTRSQFPSGRIIPPGIKKNKEFATTRDFMLSNAYTRVRYEQLKKIVQNNLKNN